jgi:hypothetical protein
MVGLSLIFGGMAQAREIVYLACEGTLNSPRSGKSEDVTGIAFVLDFAKMEISGFGSYQITEATETNIVFSRPWIEKNTFVGEIEGNIDRIMGQITVIGWRNTTSSTRRAGDMGFIWVFNG